MRKFTFLAVSHLALVLLATPVLADTYKIGPGDVLALRVLEWDQLAGTTVEWDAMRGTMPVGSDGMVSVPFIGQVNALSLTTAQMGDLVTEELRERLGVSSSLDAVISVEDYSPVYISGAVRNPGEYPFRPGLVAVQLLAQAGGSSLDRNGANIDARDIFNREGNMMLLHLEGQRLAVRRAMLQAAINGDDQLTQPEDDAWPAALVATENDVLQLRRQQRARELTALNDQIGLLNNEIEALGERSAALDRLSEIAQSEFESALALVQRGLAASARVGDAERSIAQTEAQQLEISTAILRARQGITIAEAEKLALRDRELVEDTRQLQLVDEQLEQIGTNLETQQRISVAETGIYFQESLANDATVMPAPIIAIRRATADGIVTLDGLDTPLEPGDVIEVALPRIQSRFTQQTPAAVTQ